MSITAQNIRNDIQKEIDNALASMKSGNLGYTEGANYINGLSKAKKIVESYED